MSLTRAFKKAQQANPTWGYKDLAAFLLCDVHLLRGINSRLHLPIPVRPKAPKGESKRVKGIREPYAGKITVILHRQELIPQPRARRIPVPNQMGSGRSGYFSYLKLL